MLCFSTVNDFLDIVCVYPFFGKAAAAADVAMHFYSGKYRAAENDVVSRAVSANGAVYAHDIVRTALGAKIRVFHVRAPGT